MGGSSVLGEAVVAIRGDMSKLPADLSKSSGEIKKAISIPSFGGAAALGAGVGVGLAVIQTGLETLKGHWNENAAAGEKFFETLNESSHRLKAELSALNTTGIGLPSLIKDADEIHRATGVAKAGIFDTERVLAEFGNVQGEIFKRATKVSVDFAAVTGKDLPAMAHILGAALNDPEKGMLRLRGAGIALTAIEQKLIKSFQEAGQGAKAQEILLSALEKRYAGAGNELLTPVMKLKKELQDVQTDIGRLYKEREPFNLKMKIVIAQIQKSVLSDVTATTKMLSGEAGGGLDKGAPGYLDYLKNSMAGRAFGSLGRGVKTAFGGGFLGAVDTYSGYSDAQSAQAAIDRKVAARQDKMANQKAEQTKPALDFPARRNPKADGVFDPLALARAIQSDALSKDDKMLSTLDESKDIQQRMLDKLSDQQPIPVH